MVEYRTDDAEGGEGWPVARDDHFTLAVYDGPWRLDLGDDDVADVAAWAATSDPIAGAVLAVAADTDDDANAAVLAYLDADAARALAAQLLTAADAAERGERFDPNHDHAAHVPDDL